MHTQQRSENVNAFAAGDHGLRLRSQQLAFIVGSVRAAEQPPSLSVEPRSVVTSTPMVATTAEPTSLPPEFVCQRESHCTYGINTGNGYWGKWQFASGTWVVGALRWNAAHPDRPMITSVDEWYLVQPWMEDAAAEMIWQQGAGCSHWNEC